MNRIIFSHLASFETVRTVLSHPTINEAIGTSLRHTTIIETISTSLRHPTIIEAISTSLRHPTIIEAISTSLRHPTIIEAIGTSLRHPTIIEAIGTSLRHPTIIEAIGTILSHQWRHGVFARLLPNADLLGGQRHRTCAQYRQGDSNHHVVDLVHDSVSVIGDGFVAGLSVQSVTLIPEYCRRGRSDGRRQKRVRLLHGLRLRPR
ncbi:hypothetical protein HU763_014755 [Pseudomonas anuradhapurensis]|uniref:hypothetical protein n=1 Tax=Pseudomonas anuradhapurensis TaxID=485870 RepID=UPI001C3C6DD5|nr:hypothetical protein [Pseudomonas anuradhapurensis]QXI46036.1 hypothetical protein HU763_014755 [Pseudomonas anuradhapurensis]